jgi:tRNA U34 5-methylaminomethyl-2-thiouridine-forming methyltransferase MnmC
MPNPEWTHDSVQLLVTADGSHTLYNEVLNETYHSRHGAIQESEYVYIKMGLLAACQDFVNPIQILEIGFGTGLNALLSKIALSGSEVEAEYHTLEPYPLSVSLMEKLNYPAFLTGATSADWANIIHCAWGVPVIVNPNFTLLKLEVSLEEFIPKDNFYDIVYFDAFGPNKQADVWALANIEKCAAALKPGGLLVSYAAQGAFKRNLVAAGLEMERLKGPPGKMHMVRARKPLF